MFALNTSIIWLGNNNETFQSEIKTGVVTKIGRDTIWVNHQHKAEDQIYAAFCYPDIVMCREYLNRIIEIKARHKKEEDELMKETFKLNNELVKLGLK